MFAPPSPVKEEKEKVSPSWYPYPFIMCQVKPSAIRILLFGTKYLIIPPKSFGKYTYVLLFMYMIQFFKFCKFSIRFVFSNGSACFRLILYSCMFLLCYFFSMFCSFITDKFWKLLFMLRRLMCPSARLTFTCAGWLLPREQEFR